MFNHTVAAVERGEKLEALVLALIKDIADRNKVFKSEQFTCPHIRALAKAVDWDNKQ